MAQATVIGFSKFKVELGDGATPEVFAAPCGFLARAFNEVKNLSEVIIPDCDDEEAASWIGRDVLSMTWNVTGNGVLAEESVELWEEFKASTTSRSVRITMEYPTTIVTKTGKAHLASFAGSANKGEKGTFDVDLQGDGELITVITP